MPDVAAFLKVNRRQHDKSVAGGGGGRRKGGTHTPPRGSVLAPLCLALHHPAPHPHRTREGGGRRVYQRVSRWTACLPPTSARLENIIRLEHD